MNEQQLFLTATYSDLDITTLFDETLHLIMSNLDIFLAFADKGRFTARNAPDPFSLKGSSGIPSGRNTFLTSKLMEASGFYAVPGDVIDEAVYRSQHQCPEEATTLGAAICQAANNNDQCPPEATTLGAVVCGATNNDQQQHTYWSPTTHRIYVLASKNPPIDVPQMKMAELVQNLNKGNWVDRELLFDGNYNCTLAGRAGREIVAFGNEGRVDVGCLSQLPMYFDCGTPCPDGAVLVGGVCPFGNWKRC